MTKTIDLMAQNIRKYKTARLVNLSFEQRNLIGGLSDRNLTQISANLFLI